MTLTYVKGDIFEDTGVLVIPVNCVGIMGAGLAKEFRERFPAIYRDYRNACHAGKLRMHEPKFFIQHTILDKDHVSERWFIAFPTKKDWRDKSDLNSIGIGLGALVRGLEMREIKAVAVPALGCGLGGLKWADVKALFDALAPYVEHIDFRVYEPVDGAGEEPARLL